jgi:hypothetical protein
MRLYDDTFAYAWLVEGGVALSPRFGAGVELSLPSTATGDTLVGLGRTIIIGRQRERVWLGVARFRIIATNVLAADVIAGAGILFQQHRQGACTPAVPSCNTTAGPILETRAPALVIGVDVPVRMARFFSVAVEPRAYVLRRGEQASSPPLFPPWQFEYHSSTRFTVGASARLAWSR